MNRELKAFVGLSSNLAFNEDVTDKGNPNPILESPIGLCLFYDEIWFLDESLCREMQKMAKFRNIVVHDYDKIDTEIVIGALRRGLDDFLGYKQAVVEIVKPNTADFSQW